LESFIHARLKSVFYIHVCTSGASFAGVNVHIYACLGGDVWFFGVEGFVVGVEVVGGVWGGERGLLGPWLAGTRGSGGSWLWT
jgi:hypothetical protein